MNYVYKVEGLKFTNDRTIEEILNEYGKNGWEFDKKVGNTLIFRKQERKKRTVKKSIIPK